MFSNIKYFKPKEFECPCCGKFWPNNDLLHKLDHARDLLGRPINLTSAFRCPRHNKAVGGSSTSSHLFGLAVDIHCSTLVGRHDLMCALLQAGFTRIGIRKDFIHVDVDNKKLQGAIWFYDE